MPGGFLFIGVWLISLSRRPTLHDVRLFMRSSVFFFLVDFALGSLHLLLFLYYLAFPTPFVLGYNIFRKNLFCITLSAPNGLFAFSDFLVVVIFLRCLRCVLIFLSPIASFALVNKFVFIFIHDWLMSSCSIAVFFRILCCSFVVFAGVKPLMFMGLCCEWL